MEPYQELEARFGEFLGVDNVVCCSSGTAAVHLAFEALQLPPGSKVIVPDLCMIACPRAVTLAGLEPVFVDCGDDLNMDLNLFLETIDGPTVAVLFVHNYGRRCRFPRSWDDYLPSLRVVEDMAELHGIRPHRRTDAACWSFYKNKTVCGEEGGAVCFPSREGAGYATRARSLRSLGFTAAHDFWHDPRGHNYRLANLLARPVLESLETFSAVDRAKRTLEALYDEACPAEWRMSRRDAPWVYDFRVGGMTAEQQDRAVRKIQALGIPARHCFKPCHLQPEYRRCRVVSRGRAGVASKEVIYVPFSLAHGEEKMHKVFDAVKSVLV